MDFTLDKKHLMAQDLFREFAENEAKPLAQETDETEVFPQATVDKMGKYGFMGIPIPKEYGGQGCDILTYVMAVEELSKVCATTGVILSAHTSLCVDPILTYGSPAQKEKYLPDLCSGKKLGAFGLTEPGAGTDAQGVQTNAVLDGEEWVLNGSKCFITNGKEADVYIIFAVCLFAASLFFALKFAVQLNYKPLYKSVFGICQRYISYIYDRKTVSVLHYRSRRYDPVVIGHKLCMHSALLTLRHYTLELAVLLQRQRDGYLHYLVFREYDIKICYTSQHLYSPQHRPCRHLVIEYAADLISPVRIEPYPFDIVVGRLGVAYHQQILLVISLLTDKHQQISDNITHQCFQYYVNNSEYTQHGPCKVVLIKDIEHCDKDKESDYIGIYYVN